MRLLHTYKHMYVCRYICERAFCFTTLRFEGRFWFCVCFELCRPSLLLSLKDGALSLSLSLSHFERKLRERAWLRLSLTSSFVD